MRLDIYTRNSSNCYLYNTCLIQFDRNLNQLQLYKCCRCRLDKIKTVINIEDLEKNDSYDIIKNYYFKLITKEFFCNQFNIGGKPMKCSQDSKIFRGIDVSISQACNLNCVMCSVNNKSHNDTDRLKKLHFKVLNDLKGHHLDFLQCSSMGEPFYYPEFLDYLESLDRNDFKEVSINSNLLMLNQKKINRLDNLKIPISLQVDFYGITKTTYESIMIGGSFSKFMENIEYLKKTKNINYTFLILRLNENINEIDKIIKFINTIGGKYHINTVVKQSVNNPTFVNELGTEEYEIRF